MSRPDVDREWIVENTWTCATCGAKNAGRDLKCGRCGKRRDAATVSEIPASSNPVTDETLLRLAQAGPDWTCGFCGCHERALNGSCTHCGGAHSQASDPTTMLRLTRNRASRARWVTRLAVAGVVLAAVVVVWSIVWVFTPRVVEAKIDTISWTYTAHLRERETRHASGWGRRSTRGFYDEATFNQHCERKYYGTEDCDPYQCRPHPATYTCGTFPCRCTTECTDKGNGFSSCRQACDSCTRSCTRTEYDTCYKQCPVHKLWCEYDYNEWPIRQTKETTGSAHTTQWPDFSISSDHQRIQRSEEYRVLFVSGGASYTYKPGNLFDFKRFYAGDTWKLSVGKVLGGVDPTRLVKTPRTEKE